MFFSKQFDPAVDVPSLAGKVYFVTGGNAGMGYATCQHLARHGAKVYMGARSEERANAALETLRSEGFEPGNGQVVFHPLDLSDPRKAKESGESLVQQETRLDGLILNAALMMADYAKSIDGIQDVMTVNHFSHFVFTRTLLPLLKTTAAQPGSDVRIVAVSSGAHSMVSKMRFRDLDDINKEYTDAMLPKMARYGMSKLANILFIKELQKRLDAENTPIIALSLHPGGVNTDGAQKSVENANIVVRGLFAALKGVIFRSASEGAYTSVFAAASPAVRAEPEKYKGAYLVPVAQVGQPSADARDPALAAELWATTEKVLADLGI
ncbi:NAD-P-binding protein [Obba rivulosa]|uniref:NAD-P-binding protein n=1 Tax=Obba rivulosa TaxID=1052685 RepID=A0A8E2DQS9_9APHY|nr:NAD-P-binding protein [Obba rivulosa]